MGGTSMKCVDCSGLPVTVFAKHDIILPHNSEKQVRYGKLIKGTDELRKGDLVFLSDHIKQIVSLPIRVYISGIKNLSTPHP
jgi:cell wall-associated NlpC family hydrolase